jgi:hypothetical protein
MVSLQPKSISETNNDSIDIGLHFIIAVQRYQSKDCFEKRKAAFEAAFPLCFLKLD